MAHWMHDAGGGPAAEAKPSKPAPVPQQRNKPAARKPGGPTRVVIANPNRFAILLTCCILVANVVAGVVFLTYAEWRMMRVERAAEQARLEYLRDVDRELARELDRLRELQTEIDRLDY
jgi:hypothetical protein